MNEPRVQLRRGRLAISKDKNSLKKKNFVEQYRKVLEEPDIVRCLKEGISEKVPEEPDIVRCLKEGISEKVSEEPDIERCLKEGISGNVPEEPDTEKCLKEGIDEKVQDEPNKDDSDDEKGTKKYEISINYVLKIMDLK